MKSQNKRRFRIRTEKPFTQAVLNVDTTSQLGFHCMHLLINADYQYAKTLTTGKAAPYTPFDCMFDELAQLQILIPCRDPEQPSDAASELTLRLKQYKIMRKFITKELRHLSISKTSKLPDVSVLTLTVGLMSVQKAMLSSTKI